MAEAAVLAKALQAPPGEVIAEAALTMSGFFLRLQDNALAREMLHRYEENRFVACSG